MDVKHNKSILKTALLGICVCIALPTFADNVVVSAKMDSTAIWMGEQTFIHLEVAQDKGKIVQFPLFSDSLVTGVEILNISKPDTTELSDSRIQINQNILVTSFDSGFYYIPPFKYVLNKDTFSTGTLSLKVVPLEVDTTAAPFDIKGVQAPPFVLRDFISDAALIIIGLILFLGAAGLLFWFWWSKRKRTEEEESSESKLPPYEKALQALEKLKESKLWQNGQEKEYYTQVTDILRTYIDDRFQINAMEMTSSQIMSVLHRNEETRLVNKHLKNILEVADFVKFAKMRPLPEDNESVMRNAIRFIEETKPQEVAPEGTTGKEENDSDSVVN